VRYITCTKQDFNASVPGLCRDHVLVQQVDNDLFQPHPIAANHHRLIWAKCVMITRAAGVIVVPSSSEDSTASFTINGFGAVFAFWHAWISTVCNCRYPARSNCRCVARQQRFHQAFALTKSRTPQDRFHHVSGWFSETAADISPIAANLDVRDGLFLPPQGPFLLCVRQFPLHVGSTGEAPRPAKAWFAQYRRPARQYPE
jgi:hypothetical protein